MRDSFSTTSTCPYLGTKTDPATSFRYPTLGHTCHHCKLPAVPHLEHQETYCLCEAYRDCQAYGQPPDGTLPLRLRARVHTPRRALLKPLALAICLLLFTFAGWKTLRGQAIHWLGQSPASSRPVIPVSGTEPLVVPDTPSFTPAQTALPAKKTSLPPDPLQQAAFTCQAHVLEIPFKAGEYSFLIHRVREGESLPVLEVTYVTTSEVILAINESLRLPLRANDILVLIPGLQTSEPELPAFQAYKVNEENLSLAELAQKLSVEEALLQSYNDCSNRSHVAPGGWLLIPRPKP